LRVKYSTLFREKHILFVNLATEKYLIVYYFRPGNCGSFFLWLLTSCSEVVIKKSSNDNFFYWAAKPHLAWADFKIKVKRIAERHQYFASIRLCLALLFIISIQNHEVFTKTKSLFSQYSLEWEKLSFDDFLMTTSEPEIKSQRKKKPQITCFVYTNK
jgi:hypothetical protein